jgi:hypothetical protein
MADKILARAIVEVVGKPKEYVEKTIQTVIDTATEIKGLKIEDKKVEPTKSLKDKDLEGTEKKIQEKTGELFSTFAEIEFRADNLDVVASFCFDFLPSSLEILEPEEIKVDLQDISKIMNDVLSRIHSADHVVKTLKFQNSALQKNASLLLRNMIMVSLKSKEKDLENLSKATGIPPEQLKPFVEGLVQEGFIIEESGIYKVK